MPDEPTKSKLSLSRLALYIVAAIAVLLVLRFVFSVAMSIVKIVAVVAIVALVWPAFAPGPKKKP